MSLFQDLEKLVISEDFFEYIKDEFFNHDVLSKKVFFCFWKQDVKSKKEQ